jgi:undecaprenyl-diphosphatase
MNLDLYLFNLINGFAGRWVWLDYFGIFCADYLGYILLFVLVIFLLIDYKKYWKMVLEAVVAAGVTRFVFAETIRLAWFRARPFVAENFIPLISQSPTEASFPSGHATFYFALATIVYFYNKKVGVWFFVASSFVAISRVFVAVHWPSDILAGATLGVLMGYVLNWLFRKHANKLIKNYNSQT